MRDWSEFDNIYSQLLEDVYPQPADEGHSKLAEDAIQWMTSKASFESVIDFGCGEGFCQSIFANHGISNYLGIALGEDVKVAQTLGRSVLGLDFNFIPNGLIFDAGISRHSLEHSPFPILTLCHWRKSIREWLMVVLPSAEWYRYKGKNHLSVMSEEQAENVFDLAGWDVRFKHLEYRWGLPYMDSPWTETKHEYWYLLRKK